MLTRSLTAPCLPVVCPTGCENRLLWLRCHRDIEWEAEREKEPACVYVSETWALINHCLFDGKARGLFPQHITRRVATAAR